MLTRLIAVSCLLAVVGAGAAQENLDVQDPAPQMAILQPLVGVWRAESQFRGSPQENWIASEGELRFRWAMGQRFVIEEGDVDFLGDTFEWMGIHGFDVRRGKFTSAWIDNGGTAIDQMDGVWDDATKTLTYTGEDVSGNEKPVPVKWRMDLSVIGQLSIEMIVPDASGQDFVTMKLRANREPVDGPGPGEPE